MTELIKGYIKTIAEGSSLSEKEAENAFEIIMTGEASDAQIGALLMGLRVRGETVEEITGAAKVMRAKALKVHAPDNAVDTCGTGGDGKGTHNISTGVAIVAAACGVPVAKHGNKALSSKSGSADVLTELGVNVNADKIKVEQSIKEAGICFMMAPNHHSAIKHVGKARVEIGTRTIFNLLGPLSNPAQTKRQLIGVFEKKWVEPMAEVLGRLGAEKAWVVHGEDGLDEITTTGMSYIAEYKDGEVHTFEVSPEDAGIERVNQEELKGACSKTNAEALKKVLCGSGSKALRDIILLNTAAILIIADKADSLKEGCEIAAKAIDSGTASEALVKLVAITNA